MAPSPPLPSLPQAPGSQPAKGRLLILRLSRYDDYPPSLRLIQKISKWRFQRTSKFQNFLSSSSPSKRATSSRFLSRNLARVPTHACVSPSIREKARTWTWRLSRRRGRRRSRWCWPIAGVGGRGGIAGRRWFMSLWGVEGGEPGRAAFKPLFPILHALLSLPPPFSLSPFFRGVNAMFSVGLFARCKQDIPDLRATDLGPSFNSWLVGGGCWCRLQEDGGGSRMEEDIRNRVSFFFFFLFALEARGIVYSFGDKVNRSMEGLINRWCASIKIVSDILSELIMNN